MPAFNGFIRPYKFAKYLCSKGVDTTIFASSYQHFSGDNLITDRRSKRIEITDNAKFVFINTPPYSLSKAARVKNMIVFYNGLLNVTKEFDRPDIIIASSPHPLTMLAGIKIAKKYNVPCICEVRDLWPEAIFYVSNVKPNSILGKVLTYGEHWIYHNSDALIFTKEGDTDYLREHKWLTCQGGDIALCKCHYINNGVDIDEYNEQIKKYILHDSCLEDDGTFKVIYTGTIRPVNNVSNVIETAKLLRAEKDIKFLIYGEGSQKAYLERLATDEGIENVAFKGFVERKFVPYILSKSSVNLLNYSSSRYNWSRGNSSNKLFEYMASGKPIIATMKTGYSIIDKYGCGVELDSDAPQLLADAILKVKNMPKAKYNEICINAANGAKNFDYKALSKKLMDVIDETLMRYKQK